MKTKCGGAVKYSPSGMCPFTCSGIQLCAKLLKWQHYLDCITSALWDVQLLSFQVTFHQPASNSLSVHCMKYSLIKITYTDIKYILKLTKNMYCMLFFSLMKISKHTQDSKQKKKKNTKTIASYKHLVVKLKSAFYIW